MELGDVVYSKSGRDSGRFYAEDTEHIRQSRVFLKDCGCTERETEAHIAFTELCRGLGRIFPALFSCDPDPVDFLAPAFGRDSVVHDFLTLPREDFDLRRGGQAEAVGWLYQYFHTERKEETFALLQQNVKITKERLPAATQLFTPDWVVGYLVENTVGKLWLEHHPDKALAEKWKYCLLPKNGAPPVREAALRPQDITVLDPCMGSGHILLYAFDVLMDIYTAEGYTEKEAARQITAHNLSGLEIDDAVSGLAQF